MKRVFHSLVAQHAESFSAAEVATVASSLDQMPAEALRPGSDSFFTGVAVAPLQEAGRRTACDMAGGMFPRSSAPTRLRGRRWRAQSNRSQHRGRK